TGRSGSRRQAAPITGGEMTSERAVKTMAARPTRPARPAVAALAIGFLLSLTAWLWTAGTSATGLPISLAPARTQPQAALYQVGSVLAACAIAFFLGRLAGRLPAYGLLSAAIALALYDPTMGRLAFTVLAGLSAAAFSGQSNARWLAGAALGLQVTM